ncbi:MAG TPA: adenosylcobinamide-GDP ribazoletransferase [Planctomycetota bacterium]|nr:adenosylcobinamide-GDP ribazoletransferase [Planctomycetota bacterium]
MLRGLVTALRTLTILPVPGRDAEGFGSALPFFPLVGALLGAAIWGLVEACGQLPDYGWSMGAAAAAVVGGIVLTRGLHLDGLADWADGFGGGRDRESTLRIMKDPAIGAFGAMALASVLLLKFAAVARLAASGTALWLVAAATVSRTVQVDLMVSLPYARAEGGKAGPFVQGARGWHLAAALAAVLVILLGIFGPLGAAALAAGWLFGRLFGLWCRRRVGGVTGDLLGAGSELVETALLVAAAAAGSQLAKCSGWEPVRQLMGSLT